jgi:formylglycine-generating enzyme required for sulfatase activity
VGYRLLDRAFRNPRYTHEAGDNANLFRILACYGYLMMLSYRDSKVPEGGIPKIHEEVRKRVNLHESSWTRYSEILRDTYLTEHLLLRENDERELSFPSLKMTEFFAAVWLGCHCSENVQTELQPWIGNEQWSNVWKLVAEMPETTDGSGKSVCNLASLEYALNALFSVPAANQTRPTEMMFRAWQVLTRNPELADVRKAVLHRWRAQFRSILIEGAATGQPTARAKTAAEVLLRSDLPILVEQARDERWDQHRRRLHSPQEEKYPDRNEKLDLEKEYHTLSSLSRDDWSQQIAPAEPAYCLCSDQINGVESNTLRFWMGASPKDRDAYPDREKPWQHVPIDAFYMAATCVTKAQYRLFDSQREHQHGKDFRNYAPDEDCPMINVNFHDAICFALWLGDAYRLPSEVEWEGAAWGGIDRENHEDYVIGVTPWTAKFNSSHVNFDGRYPTQGRKSNYRGRTVPVRHPEFQPNGFGLWQMSGNVWEYCRSEWHDTLQEAIDGKNADLAAGSAEAVRCVRGGSWNSYAWVTRCSNRDWNDLRVNSTGIRLSRTK